ncbi:hypothetical protein A0H81_11317 [Grifola frondosa]|uniref:Uncharacterized protein n=1 Tax=Grifola frondosa TaxID=5627 RepID=A0A1C7M1M9_GRIFR|nr:hypothetical protein A0H81_11317 [Grifola frondosa]
MINPQNPRPVIPAFTKSMSSSSRFRSSKTNVLTDGAKRRLSRHGDLTVGLVLYPFRLIDEALECALLRSAGCETLTRDKRASNSYVQAMIDT